jgi:hypothetical protein
MSRDRMVASDVRRMIQARGTVLFLACGCLGAQSLSLPPSVIAHGEFASFLLTIQSPPGKAPVALQWQFAFPRNVVIDLSDIAAGSAAESAEKSLTCRAVDKTKDAGGASVYNCILAGGQKTIPNGPVAAVRLRIPSEIRQIAEKIHVAKALAVSNDLKGVEIAEIQTAILIK